MNKIPKEVILSLVSINLQYINNFLVNGLGTTILLLLHRAA